MEKIDQLAPGILDAAQKRVQKLNERGSLLGESKELGLVSRPKQMDSLLGEPKKEATRSLFGQGDF